MSRELLAWLVLIALLAIGWLLVIGLSFSSNTPQPACPNTAPGVTPNPVLADACNTPTIFHLQDEAQDQPAPNGYTLKAPDPQAAPGWVELALPTGRWLVHSQECVLNAFVEVNYHSSDPRVAGVNDCALDAWIWLSDVGCNTDPETNQCDITLDPTYQDWVESH